MYLAVVRSGVGRKGGTTRTFGGRVILMHLKECLAPVGSMVKCLSPCLEIVGSIRAHGNLVGVSC